MKTNNPTLIEVNMNPKNKSETLLSIQAILLNHKIGDESPLFLELSNLVAPKDKTVTFPPILNDKEEIIELYCIWYKEYRPVSDFAPSKRSKNGYLYECKDASKQWMYYGKLVHQLDEDIMMQKDAVMDGVKTPEEAREIIAELTITQDKLKEDRKNKVMITIPKKEKKKEKDAEESVKPTREK